MLNNIIVMTTIQLFVNFSLVFVIFVPFAKAYGPSWLYGRRSQKVYHQDLIRQIRQGDHLLYVSVKKFINTSMNVFQLCLIIYTMSDYHKTMENIERINILKCGDYLINESMYKLLYAMSFLRQHLKEIFVLISLNVFIDYLGLKMVMKDTYVRMGRCCKRCCCCCCRVRCCCCWRRRQKRKSDDENGDDYNLM